MMRILFISNYSELYGANRSLLTIIDYFKSRGHEVTLMLPKHGGIEKVLEQKDIPFVIINCFTQLYYYKPQIKYLVLPFLVAQTYLRFSWIKEFASRFKPDLIYSNTSAENIGIKVARSLGVKHISHIREFMDLDHNARFIWGRKSKKIYINQSDGVIYVSNAVAYHVNMGESLNDWQKVIYNGVNTVSYDYSNKTLSEEINLGVVGILDPEKGQDLAIRIMPAMLTLYPKAKLHIWGDKEGVYKKSLYKLVSDLNITKNVFFHGFEQDADKIYSTMDILMMCSRCEGFGRVTIEAMQRAIPVLGYNSGGTSELVKDGINGYLFTTREECLEGLKKILSSEKEFNRIRKTAFDDARKNYTVDLYCSRVEAFVNAIVLKKS